MEITQGCSVVGCEKPPRTSLAKYCEMHYYRVRRTGEPGPAAAAYSRKPRVCAVDDCGEKPRTASSKYCGPHSEMMRRVRTPRTPKPSLPVFCSVDGCDRRRQESGMCKMHATRMRRHGDPSVCIKQADRDLPRGERSHAWTGDEATYAGIHQRLRRARGSAKGYGCVDCGASARQWSYDHADPDGRIDDVLGLPYSTDLDHYDPRCVPCHKKHDLARIKAAVAS